MNAYEFIKDIYPFYLLTISNGQPQGRPFGAIYFENGSYFVATGNGGNVYNQINACPSVQLAKAAIAAGIQSLLHAAGCAAEDVSALYLAGGFGSHLRIERAAAIGLIPPELTGRVRVIGNAALDGAALMLMDQSLRRRAEALAAKAEHIRLDGNPYFSQRYIENMLFGADI